MSTQPFDGDTNPEIENCPTTNDRPESNKAVSDEHDPYKKHDSAHGLIRDDGSPLIDGQLYPSSTEEHMQLIREQANNGGSDN